MPRRNAPFKKAPGQREVTHKGGREIIVQAKRMVSHRPLHALVKKIPVRPGRGINEVVRQIEASLGGRDQIIADLQYLPDLAEPERILLDMLADPRYKSTSLAKLAGIAGHFSIGRLLDLMKKAKGKKALGLAMDAVYERAPDVTRHIAELSVPYKMKCSFCDGIPWEMRWNRDMKGKCGNCDGSGVVVAAHKRHGSFGKVVEPTGEVGDPCEPCRATGEVLKYPPCSNCGGTGEIVKQPEFERQKFLLSLMGLPEPTPIVKSETLNVDLRAAMIHNSADFRAATDKLLWGGAKRGGVVGGETVVGEPQETIDAEPVQEQTPVEEPQ